MENIRNFAIIAHVDHGKSTLADRFLELTGVVTPGNHQEQFLDRNPISRERGITIKLAPVRMTYKLKVKSQKLKINNNQSNFDFEFFILNLIDTPGHVDFSYEVDRTLACVEGVILLVDATQGVQAQTLANLYKALDKNLVIIPAVNKIDLSSAKIEQTKSQIKDLLGVKDEEIHLVSAKTGEGVKDLLEAVIVKIPSPKDFLASDKEKKITVSSWQQVPSDIKMSPVGGRADANLKALIFDSYYDWHRGVIAFVRVFNGQIKKDLNLKLFHTKAEFKVMEVGYFTPDLTPASFIQEGEIGYVVTGLKDISQVRVGDTLVLAKANTTPLPGYKKVKPMVFASIFPVDPDDFLNLKKSLDQLSLNDSSLVYSPVKSSALGAGFRVGFLGLLHADIVVERLEREFNLSLVLTPPQIEYLVENSQGLKLKFLEPYVRVTILSPSQYLGDIMRLFEDYRGKFLTMDNIGIGDDLLLVYEMPLSEMISDFYDKLKSVSSGYASLDWELLEYRPVNAGKLELLINNDPIEEFGEVVVQEKSYQRAQFLVNRLKELIPKQQFEVKIQARYKGKIIASSTISPMRKNVLVKGGKVLGTGDIGRKKKLLERQKEGKKRMKMVGKVQIPKEAFIKLFKK